MLQQRLVTGRKVGTNAMRGKVKGQLTFKT